MRLFLILILAVLTAIPIRAYAKDNTKNLADLIHEQNLTKKAHNLTELFALIDQNFNQWRLQYDIDLNIPRDLIEDKKIANLSEKIYSSLLDGNIPKVKKLLLSLRKKYPDSWVTSYWETYLFILDGNFKKAKKESQRLAVQYPDIALFKFLQIKIFFIRGDYAQALTLNQQILKDDPRSPQCLYYNALIQELNQDPLQAAQNFRTLSRIAPNEIYTFFELARIYSQLNQHNKALHFIDHFLGRRPQNGFAQFLKIQILLDMNRREAAQRLYDQISLSTYHTIYGRLMTLAAAFKTENFNDVIKIGSELAASNPSIELYHQALFHAYLSTQQFDQAQLTAEIILTQFNSKGKENLIWGHFYFARKQYPDAITQYLKLFKLKIDDKSAFKNLGKSYHRQQQYQDALNVFERARSMFGNTFDLITLSAADLVELGRVDESMNLYQNAIKMRPYNGTGWIGLGNNYLIKKEYVLAIKSFQKAINVDSKNFESYSGLALVYYAQKHYTISIKNAQKAIDLDQTHGQAYNTLASAYRMTGQNQLAKKTCENMINAMEHNTHNLIQQGECFAQIDLYEPAIMAFEEALLKSPNSMDALKSIINPYIKLKKFSLVIKKANKILQLHPNNSYAIFIRTVAFLKLDLLEQAQESFQPIIAANRDDSKKLSKIYTDFAFAIIYHGHQNDKQLALVVNYFKKAIKALPDDPIAYYQLAHFYASREDGSTFDRKDLAVEYYKKSIDVKAIKAACWEFGILLNSQDNKHESIKYLQKTIDLEPNFLEAYSFLASILINVKEYEAAISVSKKNLEIDPESIIAYRKMAQVYIARKNYKGALKQYLEALQIKPDDIELLYDVAHFFKASGKLEESISYANKIIEIDPNVAKAYDMLGLAYSMENNMILAEQNFKKAIKLAPKSISQNNIGFLYLQNKNLKKAIHHFNIAILNDQGPDLARAYHNLGMAHFFNGEEEIAFEKFRFAIDTYNEHKLFSEAHRLEQNIESIKKGHKQ